MKQRKLGTNGPSVGIVGLGCMSFGGTMSGSTDQATSFAAMDQAWDMGISHFDTANIYGPHRSEQVVGEWMALRGHKPSIATKASVQRDPARPVNNDPAYLETELEGSFARLGVDYVDLFYIHRREPAVPIADVAGLMRRLMDQGKIGGWGMSEVSPTTLRRAHAETPVSAIQNEYSLWTRQPELGLLQECERLGTAFVAFSPLARGVFGRQVIDPTGPDFGSLRAVMPRFQGENWIQNKKKVEVFRTLAMQMDTSVPALALAWVMAQGDHIIPIPGSRTSDHIGDWEQADKLEMTANVLQQIDTVLPVGWAWGDRYNEAQAKTPQRYC